MTTTQAVKPTQSHPAPKPVEPVESPKTVGQVGQVDAKPVPSLLAAAEVVTELPKVLRGVTPEVAEAAQHVVNRAPIQFALPDSDANRKTVSAIRRVVRSGGHQFRSRLIYGKIYFWVTV